MPTNAAEVRDALCRQRFDAFAEKAFQIVYPGIQYEWSWHLGCIAEHLEACARGELLRLIINMPPRSLKSFFVTTAYPAWILGKQPHKRFICGSYGKRLAKRHSMDTRRIMEDPWYGQAFPECRINPEQNEKDLFYTTRNGMRLATSILGAVTGEGGDTLILDDPIKPTDAKSPTILRTTNETLDDTFMSRYVDPRTFCIIGVMQRTGVDDPTQHLIEKGGYTVLKLPAEAKTQVFINIGDHEWSMGPGDLLHRTRLTKAILDEKRRDMGEYDYAGQYLQEPQPMGGGEFKEKWVQYYDPVGIGNYGQYNVYILVDPAGKGSDWTAMLVVGLGPDNNYYLLDGIRDHMSPTQRVDNLFMLHRKWNALCKKAPTVGYEQYGIQSDTHYIEEKQKRDNYRFPMVELKGNEKDRKLQDIRRLIPDMQTGRWYVPHQLIYVMEIEDQKIQVDLVEELVKGEMIAFPFGGHDDLLDDLSRIYDEELGAVFPMLQDPEPEYTKQVGSTAMGPKNEDRWENY